LAPFEAIPGARLPTAQQIVPLILRPPLPALTKRSDDGTFEQTSTELAKAFERFRTLKLIRTLLPTLGRALEVAALIEILDLSTSTKALLLSELVGRPSAWAYALFVTSPPGTISFSLIVAFAPSFSVPRLHLRPLHLP
jgi:hypothetical protein